MAFRVGLECIVSSFRVGYKELLLYIQPHTAINEAPIWLLRSTIAKGKKRPHLRSPKLLVSSFR